MILLSIFFLVKKTVWYLARQFLVNPCVYRFFYGRRCHNRRCHVRHYDCPH